MASPASRQPASTANPAGTCHHLDPNGPSAGVGGGSADTGAAGSPGRRICGAGSGEVSMERGSGKQAMIYSSHPIEWPHTRIQPSQKGASRKVRIVIGGQEENKKNILLLSSFAALRLCARHVFFCFGQRVSSHEKGTIQRGLSLRAKIIRAQSNWSACSVASLIKPLSARW